MQRKKRMQDFHTNLFEEEYSKQDVRLFGRIPQWRHFMLDSIWEEFLVVCSSRVSWKGLVLNLDWSKCLTAYFPCLFFNTDYNIGGVQAIGIDQWLWVTMEIDWTKVARYVVKRCKGRWEEKIHGRGYWFDPWNHLLCSIGCCERWIERRTRAWIDYRHRTSRLHSQIFWRLFDTLKNNMNTNVRFARKGCVWCSTYTCTSTFWKIKSSTVIFSLIYLITAQFPFPTLCTYVSYIVST